MAGMTRSGETASGGTPIVEAKLAPPSLGPHVVERQRIAAALDGGPDTRVAVVVAPAGYGKTIAARAWCARRGTPFAWVTLDSSDDDAARLWTSVATAVDRVREGLGRSALQRLRAPGAPVHGAVDELMNGIGAFDRELVLVLDELETLSGRESIASVQHAIGRLPANARLIVAARSDPSLNLSRLRVRRALLELRASDLAFRADEARELLARRKGVRLADAELEMLLERTEGWPAALELAAAWLRDVDDPEVAVREFTGNHRFVADYLSDEVLAALDAEVRGFLLRASVLGRFTSELCDSVLDRTDSAAMLSGLERWSPFVTRLEHGGWFRVHPLFGEYASFRLAEEGPGEAAEIHRRAAQWYVAVGLPVEAVEHAALADDLGLAARILTESHLDLVRQGGARTLLRWGSAMPVDRLLDHPELAAAAATAAAIVGGASVERRRLLAVVDRAEVERPERTSPYASAGAAMVRAAVLDGGLDEAVANGRRAVELAQAGADDVLLAALGAHARALYFAGELQSAWEVALRAVEHPDAERRAPGHAFARSTLAFVAADQGRLASARLHAEKARAIVGGMGSSRSWLGANAAAALGLVHALDGRHDWAERDLSAAERLLHEEVATVHHCWALLHLARVRCVRGRVEAARAAFDAAREEMAELVDSTALDGLAAAVGAELERARARAGSGEVGEPPSPAELAVLRLLAGDLSNREIGTALFLSPHTVRSHTRAIYRKLGVNKRADAVARAESLGLLGETETASRCSHG